METHSGKDQWMVLVGLSKTKFRFSRLPVSTPKKFADGGSNLTASFTSLYLPINEDETENITNAPTIQKSTGYKVSRDREVRMGRSILSFQTNKKPLISLNFTDLQIRILSLTLMLVKSSMKILLDTICENTTMIKNEECLCCPI